MQLLTNFLSQDQLELKEKQLALDMADMVINTDTDASGQAESLIQALLLSIIDDERCVDSAAGNSAD